MWMENKNDKYMFRESYIDPLTEKKKIVSVTMKSKSRASQKRAKIILSEKIEKRLSKFNGSNIITGQTIEKCIQEWLPEYQQLVKPNTYSSTVNTFIPFFRKHFDFNIIINNLTPEYISKTFEDIQFTNQYAISTIKQMFAKTCVFLKWCVKHSYLNNYIFDIYRYTLFPMDFDKLPCRYIYKNCCIAVLLCLSGNTNNFLSDILHRLLYMRFWCNLMLDNLWYSYIVPIH